MNVNIVKEYPTPFGSDNVISMRGYSKPSSTSAIETTDTLNTAIGKLEKAIESGSGNTVSKTRYQISSSSWSSSANSDGFYTLTTTLNPAIGSSPDVYVAGSADGTQPTDTEKGQFAYVKRCKVNGSTLTLYASSKPSSTFYIWVEGVNGTGSGDIVGNIIQPNGAVSQYQLSTSEEVFTGRYWTDGSPIFEKVFTGTLSAYNRWDDNECTYGVTLPINIEKIVDLSLIRLYKNDNSTKHLQFVCEPAIGKDGIHDITKGFVNMWSNNTTETYLTIVANVIYVGGTCTFTVNYTK